MYKNIYDTPEEIEVSFSVSDTSLYRLPLGRMFTTHEIWTGTGKTGTQLVSGTDYVAGGESARAGEIKGESVYTGFQITNAGYHSTTLYATIYWVGSLVNAEVKNGKGIETITATTYTIDDFGLDVYEVNTGECTITLPDRERWQGREITVRAITAATTGISIEAAGSDFITKADLTDVSLTSDGDFWVFFAGSTRWELVDGVESGTGYKKNPNGTAYVFKTSNFTATLNTAFGNIFRSGGLSAISYGITFTETPSVTMFTSNADGAGTWPATTGVHSATATSTFVIVTAQSDAVSRTFVVAVNATGRWYA